MTTTARDSARKEMSSFLILAFAWTLAFWLGLRVLCARGVTSAGMPLALLAMALVWILWHLPLWLIPDTYQNLHLDLLSFALGVGATSLVSSIQLLAAAVLF